MGEHLMPVYLAEDRPNTIVGDIRVAKLLFEYLVLGKEAYKRRSNHVVLPDLVVESSNKVLLATYQNKITICL